MDFIYIDDVIAQLEYLIENINEIENKCYDIGTGHGISIFDVAKKIIRMTGNKSKIIFSPNRSGDKMLEIVAHKKKILTNSISFHQLEDGLSKTIDYYKRIC